MCVIDHLSQVPAPGKVTFFDGEVADLDTKVDDFFSGPNDATSNYAERMQFDDFFVLDLILSMDGGPMTDYIIHVSVEAKPATGISATF